LTKQLRLSVCSFLPSFIHCYSALDAGLAGTRAQSCDRYGSGTLHPGQVLGGSLPLFPPPLDVPSFAARCLYVRNDARDPSSERWNCGREIARYCCLNSDFHVNLGIFCMPQIYFTSEERRAEDFSP